MSTAQDFKTFLENLRVGNKDIISLRYDEITLALNKDFRNNDSPEQGRLQVGSYGRKTAINGVSDLDMLYILPNLYWDTYKNNQRALLTRTAAAIKARYPKTNIKVDRLVVRVLYTNFDIEVQPVFEQADKSFIYPDTYYEGTWKTTKPRDELKAMVEFNGEKNNNLRRLCKMVRAWKNKQGVAIGGLLIDTFAHSFLQQTNYYDDKSYLYYDEMCRDFFNFISQLPKQEYFLALGSNQRVHVKGKFQSKAMSAYEKCQKAINETDILKKHDIWKTLFGRTFPLPDKTELSEAFTYKGNARDTEEFFEDKFPINIQYDVKIECDVTQNGSRPSKLCDFIIKHQPLSRNRKLHFSVSTSHIEEPHDLYWKVLNRGSEAIKRDCIRGNIFKSDPSQKRNEITNFVGDHLVECAVVQNGIIVARDLIEVCIGTD